jgi:hypothetical protein
MTPDLVFIGSGAGTGTQFFGDMLKTVIDDCWSEHEPDMVLGLSSLTLARVRRFGFWHMIAGRLLSVTGVRCVGHKLLTGALSEDDCARRLRHSRRRYHGAIRESLIVESYARSRVAGEARAGRQPRGRVMAPRPTSRLTAGGAAMYARSVARARAEGG